MRALRAIAVPFGPYVNYHGGPLLDWYGEERISRIARLTGSARALHTGLTGKTSSEYGMKIDTLETLRPAGQANLCFVRLHTDTGLTGLGETFYGAAAVEAYLHDQVAPELLGLADPSPEMLAHSLKPYVGYQGSGVETRASGAVDIALWDLLARSAGLPLVDMLGGAVRESAPIYNTCAGARYVSEASRQDSSNWGLPDGEEPGPYEDLHAFLTRPGELARELAAEGIGGMKVWPFDRAAERTGGLRISRDELRRGIATVAAIREATDIDVMVELHGLWYPPAAAEICRALADYEPTWVEDPIPPDAANALAGLRSRVDVPIATGETAAGRRAFLPLLDAGAVDVVTLDPSWTGGITEARKVAVLADAYGVPVAPHDCTGPVSLAVATHLVCAQPNGLVQEIVRAFLRTWYPGLADGLPTIREGRIAPRRVPGHGVQLTGEFLHDAGTASRVSRL